MTKEKVIYEGLHDCPYCGKRERLRLIKDILTPGVKAETQLRLVTDKDDQDRLDKDKEPVMVY